MRVGLPQPGKGRKNTVEVPLEQEEFRLWAVAAARPQRACRLPCGLASPPNSHASPFPQSASQSVYLTLISHKSQKDLEFASAAYTRIVVSMYVYPCVPTRA